MKRSTTRYVAGAAITAALALGGVGLANAQSSDTTDSGGQTVTITDDAGTTDTGTTDTGTTDAADDSAPVTLTDDAAGMPAPGDRAGGPGADGGGRGRGPGDGGCDQADTGGDTGTTGAPAVLDEQAPTTVAPSTDAPSTDTGVTVDAGDL